VTKSTKSSAGLLLYRKSAAAAAAAAAAGDIEVLIVHPGGPFWAKKDDGAWSIPKGEHGPGEDPLECARREFEEELGFVAPEGPLTDLGEITQRGGKRVRAWALEGDLDVSQIHSNTFEMEWPPRSGRRTSFPEVDTAEWVTLDHARRKLVAAQAEFLDRLAAAGT